jgi:hypothetical protein
VQWWPLHARWRQCSCACSAFCGNAAGEQCMLCRGGSSEAVFWWWHDPQAKHCQYCGGLFPCCNSSGISEVEKTAGVEVAAAAAVPRSGNGSSSTCTAYTHAWRECACLWRPLCMSVYLTCLQRVGNCGAVIVGIVLHMGSTHSPAFHNMGFLSDMPMRLLRSHGCGPVQVA